MCSKEYFVYVPQGSHLEPLYFIWFVNEIVKLFFPVRGFKDFLKTQAECW
jgi:hypothetical protein